MVQTCCSFKSNIQENKTGFVTDRQQNWYRLRNGWPKTNLTLVLYFSEFFARSLRSFWSAVFHEPPSMSSNWITFWTGASPTHLAESNLQQIICSVSTRHSGKNVKIKTSRIGFKEKLKCSLKKYCVIVDNILQGRETNYYQKQLPRLRNGQQYLISTKEWYF